MEHFILRAKDKTLRRGDTITSPNGNKHVILRYYGDNLWNRLFNSNRIGCYKTKRLIT